jgi:dTDP-4-amino-4,6-dideoxygalactose transaminase
VKIITTGEGGMCLTNSAELATKLARLRSHGIVRHPSELTHVADGPWYYQQIELGFNYRMTDIQAALGLSQMSRLEEFVKSRHLLSDRYDELLQDSSVTIPYQHPDTYSATHLYIIRVPKNGKNKTHLQLFENLRLAGILVNLHYIPIYKHPFYEKMGYDETLFPESESYYSEAISIPMYSSLTISDQDIIIEKIKKPLGFQNLF